MLTGDLLTTLNTWLRPENFSDAAHNGLQVSGRSTCQKIICGVSANRALIEAAIEKQADAIFVHHGLFWRPGLMSMTGLHKERLGLLLKNDINLFAYHLPLDAHESLGNNAEIARTLGLVKKTLSPFGQYKNQSIGFMGNFSKALAKEQFLALIKEKIGGINFSLGDSAQEIERVAICSGAAPELFEQAIAAGADAYICGEATEWVTAMAREAGVLYVAAGHHRTETFGPKAICEKLHKDLGLDAFFVDVPNPV